MGKRISRNVYRNKKKLETPVSGFADTSANIGEIINEDGSATKIHFVAMHGSFTIYKYDANWDYEPEDELSHGEYKLKGDTLTLKCTDGTEIVLTKVGDVSAQSTGS